MYYITDVITDCRYTIYLPELAIAHLLHSGGELLEMCPWIDGSGWVFVVHLYRPRVLAKQEVRSDQSKFSVIVNNLNHSPDFGVMCVANI